MTNAIELFMVPWQKKAMNISQSIENKIEFLSKNLKQSVVLVGLMGAGKSSIGSALAKRLNIEFVDSDIVIEGKERRTITDIFANSGEKYFRDMERETLINLAQEKDVMVIGTGGGAFINDETRQIIKQKTISIFLKADLEVLIKRVGNGAGRPLFKDKTPKEVLEKLIEARYSLYHEADLAVQTKDEVIQETLHRVIESLYSFVSRR